jgi:hypothetical protein
VKTKTTVEMATMTTMTGIGGTQSGNL